MSTRYPGRKRGHVDYTQNNYDTALWMRTSEPGHVQDAVSPDLGAPSEAGGHTGSEQQAVKRQAKSAKQAQQTGRDTGGSSRPKDAAAEDPHNAELPCHKRLESLKCSSNAAEQRPVKIQRRKASNSTVAVDAVSAMQPEQHLRPESGMRRLPSVAAPGTQKGVTNQQAQGRQQPQQQAKHAEPADIAELNPSGAGSGKSKSSTSTTSRSSKQHRRFKQTPGPDSNGSQSQTSGRAPVATEAAQAEKKPSRSRKSTSAAAVTAKPASNPVSCASACQRTSRKQALKEMAGRNSSEAPAGRGRTASAGVQPAAGGQPAMAVAKPTAAGGVLHAGSTVMPVPCGSKHNCKEVLTLTPAAGLTASIGKAAVDAAAIDGAAGGSRTKPHSKQQQPDAALVTAVQNAAISSDALTVPAGSDEGNMLDFAKLQAEHHRLHAMYDELKAQKIQEMEGLVQEQDDYIVKMGEEARQLAEHWRKEAEAQKKAAASACAPETQRLVKKLQDRDIAARATLLEKDTALAQLQVEIAELKHKLLDAGSCPAMVDASVQVLKEHQDAALDPLTADIAQALAAAEAEAAETTAPPGRQFAACQFPSPHVFQLVSPGVGCQFPTPGAAVANNAAATPITAGTTQAVALEAKDCTNSEAHGRPVAAGDVARSSLAKSMPEGSRASLTPCTASLAAVATAVEQPLLAVDAVPADEGALQCAANSGGGSNGVWKQLQLSPTARESGSSPVRGLVVRARAGQVPHSSALCVDIVTVGATDGSGAGAHAPVQQLAAAGPYITPGGINAFMFAAPSAPRAAAATSIALERVNVAGCSGDFRFPSSAGIAGHTGHLGYPLQQGAGFQMQPCPGGGGVVAGCGSGGQNSDNGTFMMSQAGAQAGASQARNLVHQQQQQQQQPDKQLAAAPAPAPWDAVVGAQGDVLSGHRMMHPPLAPHSTPTAGCDAATTGIGAGFVRLRQQQQHHQSPVSSTGSLLRYQARIQQLDHLRLALKQGLEPMLAQAAAEGPATREGVITAAAATPTVAMDQRVVSGNLVQQTPLQAYRNPACTPCCTPDTLGPAGSCLPAGRVTAAETADVDAEAGFAGFFSPPAAVCSPGTRLMPATSGRAAPAAEQGGDSNVLAAGSLAAGGEGAGAAEEHTPQCGMRPPGNKANSAVGHLERHSRITPSGSKRCGPRSFQKHLLPLTFLCGFDPQLLSGGNILYRHSATGFTFQLGPAQSAMTAPTPACSNHSTVDGSEHDEGMESSEEGEGEEVAFVPLQTGCAEAALPGFLKEPITFAPAQKPQFMKLLFQALAEATKAKAAAAATAQQLGGRHRRPGRHQQQQGVQGDATKRTAGDAAEQTAAGAIAVDDACAPEDYADKENAGVPGCPAANKATAAAMQEAQSVHMQ